MLGNSGSNLGNRQLQSFICEYAEPYTGRPYGFLIHAANEKACKLILKDLNLRTELCGKGNGSGDQHRIHTWAHKSQRGFVKQIPRVLHHICFVAHMVSRRKKNGIHEGLLVSDTGIVHSIAHMLLFPYDPVVHFETRRDVIVGKVSSYEMFAPWLWPGEERAL